MSRRLYWNETWIPLYPALSSVRKKLGLAITDRR
jgi:hypothetical protein